MLTRSAMTAIAFCNAARLSSFTCCLCGHAGGRNTAAVSICLRLHCQRGELRAPFKSSQLGDLRRPNAGSCGVARRIRPAFRHFNWSDLFGIAHDLARRISAGKNRTRASSTPAHQWRTPYRIWHCRDCPRAAVLFGPQRATWAADFHLRSGDQRKLYLHLIANHLCRSSKAFRGMCCR